MGDASHMEASFIDSRGVGALGDNFPVLRVLGRLREERVILSISFSPPLISDYVLWQKQQGKVSSLPTYIFGMGGAKERDQHVTDTL